ncbi:MAG: alpha/beta hydrolase, partial [Candidatus Thorarchaeota archaeon]
MTPQVNGIVRKPAGANVSFLLIHGFCADVDELASLGEELERKGIASLAMQIAGHGTSPEDLASSTWNDWYSSVVNALNEVKSWKTKHVFVAGLSMGAALTLYLTTKESGIDGIVILSPAIKIGGFAGKMIPILKHLIKYRSIDLSYIPKMYDLPRTRYDREPLSAIHELLRLSKEVRKALPEVSIPTLVIKAGADKTVNPENANYVFNNISS